ncbi:MAG: hypothetical protein EOO23_01745 [Comamonadaceae bacterium]|nr:MAG: hypothetical protein EOO23_01745 [Comamonadaceae bacterium]
MELLQAMRSGSGFVPTASTRTAMLKGPARKGCSGIFNRTGIIRKQNTTPGCLRAACMEGQMTIWALSIAGTVVLMAVTWAAADKWKL